MRRDPRSEGWRWLEQAQADLHWTCHLNDQGAYYLVCFLAQQAAEKALKAFLYAQGEELVVGHSVRQLCQQATEYDARFQPSLRQAAEGALALAQAVAAEVESWFAELVDD